MTLRFQGITPQTVKNEAVGRFYKPVRLIAAELTDKQDWRIQCAVLMPDHLHMLVTLGSRLTVSQCVAKFKTGIRQNSSLVAFHHFAWQDNFFEHRLRPEEDSESYARYIFLNPYRAGLLARQEIWPWWWSETEHRWAFEAHLEDGHFPLTEWLADDDKNIQSLMGAGES